MTRRPCTYGPRPYGEIEKPDFNHGSARDLDPHPLLDDDELIKTFVLRPDFADVDAGGLVEQWLEPVNGYHFSSPIITERGEYKPAGWSTGKPTVAGDGYLTRYEGFPVSPTGKHIIIAAVKINSALAGRRYLLDSQLNFLIFTLSNASTDVPGFYTSAGFEGAGPILTTGEHVIVWELISGGANIWVDGVQRATSLPYNNQAYSASNSTTLFRKRTDPPLYPCDIELGEIMGLQNNGLDGDQRGRVDDYWEPRYDIAPYGGS